MTTTDQPPERVDPHPLTATALTLDEQLHVARLVSEHAGTCDCPAQSERHREHSPRSRESLADEALYDMGLLPEPPHDARITCRACRTHWASEGDLTRARHLAQAANPDLADGVCPECWHELESR